MKKPYPFFIVLLAIMLVACGDDDNSEPPAELVPFDAATRIKQLWSSYANTGIDQQYLAIEPLVLNDHIVTVDREGGIAVINKSDGYIDREFDLDVVISGGVGGNEKTWLFTTRDAELIAVDAVSGDILWRATTPSEALSKPMIYMDSVLVRSVDGQIVSFDLSTGKMRWSYQYTKPPLTLRGSSDPVLARDRIYVGLANGRLIALSPKNGEIIWEIAQTIPQGHSEIQRLVDIDGRAELYGHVLYVVSYQGRMTAIDVQRGQFLWARPFSSYSGVTVDDKYVYSSDDRSYIWALDRFSGSTVWKQEQLRARKVTRPVSLDDYIVVGDFEGYIHVMSKADGKLVAREFVGDLLEDELEENGIIVAPSVDKDTFYISTRKGMLYAYTITQPGFKN